MQRFAIVDIETTGSWSAANGITEIAVLIHDGSAVVDSYETLINPGTPILPFVQRLTGITNEMVQDAPPFYEVAKKIWTMTDDAVFVAHSVNFDYSFIRNAFKDLGADYRRRKLCTVRLSRKLFPGLSSYSLGNICSSIGIKINDRHRAMGDATATARLFELCLVKDREGILKTAMGKTRGEAVLPPLLPKEVYDALPEKPGVYYFHDLQGKIIYVGKAINIKSRIYSHFTGSSGARLSFTSSIADITYTHCGTELIALLLESAEIKRLYPIYNHAQKYDSGSYVLVDYTDNKGVHHILFTKNHKVLDPITSFRSFEAARQFMFRLIKEHDLCPKYCGMHTSTGACFDYQLKKCKGVCAGIEPVHIYNERVALALQNLNGIAGTRLIIDEGREWNEKSVVLIENGIYKGFGYFDSSEQVDSAEKARDVIHPYKHTADIQRILNAFEE